MTRFALNLKHLREQTPGPDGRKLAQQAVADALGIKRSTLNDYERGAAEPSFEVLLKLAAHYRVSADQLLRHDLTSLDPEGLNRLRSAGAEAHLHGAGLRVLATTVDDEGRENVEMVPIKAAAGYASGYGDVDFIRTLPRLRLPFLSAQKKYRMFPITGDSMPPVAEGDWVIGAYLQDFSGLKADEPAIVVTVDDGIVFKHVTVQQNALNGPELLLRSANPLYETYTVGVNQVREIWRYAGHFSQSLHPPLYPTEDLLKIIAQLQAQLAKRKDG